MSGNGPRFPVARIKKIMQSDEEVGKIASGAPLVISRCIELLLKNILEQCQGIAAERGAKTITPYHLKLCAMSNPAFDFMKSVVEDVSDMPVARKTKKRVREDPKSEKTSISSLASGSGFGTTTDTPKMMGNDDLDLDDDQIPQKPPSRKRRSRKPTGSRRTTKHQELPHDHHHTASHAVSHQPSRIQMQAQVAQEHPVPAAADPGVLTGQPEAQVSGSLHAPSNGWRAVPDRVLAQLPVQPQLPAAFQSPASPKAQPQTQAAEPLLANRGPQGPAALPESQSQPRVPLGIGSAPPDPNPEGLSVAAAKGGTERDAFLRTDVELIEDFDC